MLPVTVFYYFCSLTFPMAYIPTLITSFTMNSSDALPNVFTPMLHICTDTPLGEILTPVSPN